jgi:opacity protein-like surface antigen
MFTISISTNQIFMKKTLQLLFAAMLMTVGSAMAQEASQSTEPVATQSTELVATQQEKSKFRVGAGLVFGSEAGIGKGGAGINIGGEYFFTENVSAAPSFTYFFKSKEEYSNGYNQVASTVQYNSINLDGRYYFHEMNNFTFYGLAGISIVSVKAAVEYDGRSTSGAADSEMGLNLGAGLIYPLNETFSLNGQVKYNTPLKQVALQAGITFPISIR